MDAKLRRALDAIARDNRSGGAELTLRAVAGLQQWLRRRPEPTEAGLLAVARRILNGQRSMAPLLRLANEVALAADGKQPAATLRRTLSRLRIHIRRASGQIAARFQHWIRTKPDSVVMTYSYSSTAAKCLIQSRSSLHSVFCSEGRPAGEGFTMARRLASAGITVTFCTEATLTGQVWPKQILLLGADALLNGAVAGKVGTNALIRVALLQKCPVIIAADTTKFWREGPGWVRHWHWTFGPDEEIWKAPPKKVDVYNLYFELTRFTARSPIRFLTERGWMTPKQVRAELKKIRISPRLKTLVD